MSAWSVPNNSKMVQKAKATAVFIALLIFSMTTIAGVPQFAEPFSASGLRWKKVSIPIAFSNSLLKPNPAMRPESDIQGAVERSLKTWEAAANIEFQVTWSDKLSVSPAGNAGDGTSLVTIAQTPENLVVFSGDTNEISARTRVFFNRKNEISEADIVFNPYQQFSTDGAIGTYDFESTLTHEIGHLLGLAHSTVIGATMNEHQGKNGIFNLLSFSPRTLSGDDISQIRAIYGAKENEECCGALDGKILLSNVKAAKNLNFWLEDADSGRVMSGGKISPDGSFTAKGLESGKYRIYAQDSANNLAGQILGDIEITKNKTANFSKKVSFALKDFDVQLTGFSGQLAQLAIPINGGKIYQIYVGGKNLDPENLKIGTTSPFFTVSNGTVTKFDYGKELTVFSFEIKCQSETPIGDYTFYLQNTDGKIEFLTGSLTVEKFANPWNVLASE